MKHTLFSKYLTFILFLIPHFYNTLFGQNINDYKLLLKVNASDLILMGRVTGECEIPIFKNTSLTSNLGFQFSEYFYDNEPKTSTSSDFNFFSGFIDEFPASNVLGFNLGLGIRQYINLKYDLPKRDYFEVKGYYRFSQYLGKYEVFWNDFLDNEEKQLVKGNQQLGIIYFAWGRNNYFFKERIGVDFSIGFTHNFVKLATCQNDCTNIQITKHPAFIYTSIDFLKGNFHASDQFNKFRMEVKITFLRKKNE